MSKSQKLLNSDSSPLTLSRLLRKVDLYTYPSENNHREQSIRRRYHLTHPQDYHSYNKLSGSLRQLAHRLSLLDPTDPFRIKQERLLLEKLYDMGLIKQKRGEGAGLSQVERDVSVSAFARRRLPIVMVRIKMVETLKAAVGFIEQGHVRVGTEVVTDGAFLVTRNMEDFVTWVDGSKVKRQVMQYRDQLDDFELL
jgi:U3 small nucleolar ribonucleoprotein protein IMP3